MNKKKLCAALLAMSFVFGTGASMNVEAATRAEIAQISVKKNGSDFKYWNQDSASFKALTNYVKDVTNKKSPNYIPVEDRIAVFDMDGTLLGERTPSYFEWMMYLERALNDPTYTPSKEDREYAKVVKAAIDKHAIPEDMEGKEAKSQASVFAGMTQPEYEAFVKKFMETPAEGLTNLKRGEEFYLPMAEVVSYLKNNDFDIWIVSGSDRDAQRVLMNGVLPIKRDHFIGTDIMTIASGQGSTDGLEYVYDKDKDVLVRGQFVLKDVKMNKVSNIAREIGRQPVLAFGNSSGDASMFNYTISKNKYKSLAFSLCCDDLENDLGNTKKADKMKADCQKNGWIPVSMRDDWKTIYGYNVKVAK